MKTPKRLVPYLLLAALAVPLVNCSKKDNPSPAAPNTPAATATPTPVTYFVWNSASVYRYNNLGTVSLQANVSLSLNGAAPSNVGVTLSGSGVGAPVALAYSGLVTAGGVYASYLLNGGFSYTPGQSYVLTTTSGAYSASATLTAPGNITNAADGSQASWTYSGTQNLVDVHLGGLGTFNSTTYSTTVGSPYNIPVTAYTGGGTFKVTTTCDSSTSSVTGASASYFQVSDTLVTSVVVATPTPSFTPTPTDTASYTPTLTKTNTGTFTPTPTYTFSSTPTATPTNTGTPTWTNTCSGGTPCLTSTFTDSPTITDTPTKTATPTWTDSPTATFTFTATATATFTATLTSTPYPTPAVSTAPWNFYNQSGHIFYTTYNGGEILYGFANYHYVGKTDLTGANASYFPSISAPFGTGPATFGVPKSVVADAAGNLYIADYYFNTVQKLSPTGTFIWSQGQGSNTAGSGVSQFSSPTGVSLDGTGDLFVTDYGNSRVVKLNATTGAWTAAWSGTGGPTTMNYPLDLFVDQTNQRIYVTDFGNSGENDHVFKYDMNGNYLNSWGGSGCACTYIQNPAAIAVNFSGTRVYVADSQNNFVEAFDQDGNFLFTFGTAGTAVGNYVFGASGSGSPTGIAVDTTGKVYVDDDGYYVIHVFTGTP